MRENVPLAPLTTLGIGGAAKRFETFADVRELSAALDDAETRGDRVMILGGGSNLVVGDAGWDGLVLQPADRTVTRRGIVKDVAIVSAFAGAVWDDFVAEMVADGAAGVEALSGIPGLVGATPMQNVGAYGQEVADTIVFVRAWDRQKHEIVKFEKADCQFAYRSSMFKGSSRWIIFEVRFALPMQTESMPVTYPELAKALGIAVGGTAPLALVRETVIRLRRGKGMVVDPSDPESRSAGSFFTNPIVAPEIAIDVEARAGAKPPQWPNGDHVKLAAAWLIERAGFVKGETRGNVGISSKHALALVNRGGATASELIGFANEIIDGVRNKLGVTLVPEPIIL
ncbi:MAG: UDP-N-acetylmuramate dehydrogenase [Kofleriaceae bacterium]